MDLLSSRLLWLAAPLAAWVVWVATLFLAQRRMIFPRHLLNPPIAEGAPPGAEKVSLETPSGPGIAYWLEPSGVEGPAPAVIFAHGNAELAREWAGAWRTVAARGVGVLLVEYPGYGDAPGAPTLESITDVMVAAWDDLAERPSVDERRIVGLGRSLGGGAVTALATRRPLAGLILQSTFTATRAFARRFLVPGFLVRDPFDNLAVLESFDRPVLLFHGRRDEVIPYEHGRRLAAAAGSAELVTWPCGHNDCPPDWTDYTDRVVDFVKGLDPVERSP